MDYDVIRNINQVSDEALLTSGETTRLQDEQKGFNKWMIDDVPEIPGGTVWSFETQFEENENAQTNFYAYIARHIRSIPAEQYLLRYFMSRYEIPLSEYNFRELWEKVKEGGYKLSTPRNCQSTDLKIEALRKKYAGRPKNIVQPLEQKDIKEIMSLICAKVRDDFPPALLESRKTAWTTRFKGFLNKLTLNGIHELALGLSWDWRTYQLFRSKALKKRGFDFLDREEVFLNLALNYANACGVSCYDAFTALEKLYPAPQDTSEDPGYDAEGDVKDYFGDDAEGGENDIKDPSEKESAEETAQLKTAEERKAEIKRREKEERKNDPGDSSARIERKLIDTLEINGALSPEYQKQLFSVQLPFLTKIFKEIDTLRRKKVKRSPLVELTRQWNAFTDIVKRYEYTKDETQYGQYKVSGFLHKRHELFRWLYGENVETQCGKEEERENSEEEQDGTKNAQTGTDNENPGVTESLESGDKGHDETKETRGIRSIKDEDMVRLAPPGVMDFYLDSKEFLETRLRDSDFSPQLFSGNETRQRNLLLTVGFLNFVYTDRDKEYGRYQGLDYQDRLSYFDYETQDPLNDCGFLSLHSGSAYDAFLKLLLSCDEPLDLFRRIWHMKTGSPIEE